MFDNEFDQLMEEVDSTVFDSFGVWVKVDGGEPVRAIYDESLNQFDAMAGIARKLTFKKSDNVRPKKGARIEFVSSGRILTVTSGPYPEDGNIEVIL